MPIHLRQSFRSLLGPLATREDMESLGKLLIERIRRRTLAGQDAEGQPFAGYSAGYAKRKSDALGTTRVDLQISGELLNNLTVVDVTERRVTLGWKR
jgi:hypothetical protein